MVTFKLFANVNPLASNTMVEVLNSRTIMDSSEKGQKMAMYRKYLELKKQGYSVALYKVTEECVCTHKAVSLI